MKLKDTCSFVGKLRQTSVQISCSVVSNSLQLHGLQHARLPCSPTLGAYSNSCPLSWWCHPTISSSVIPSPPAFNFSQNQGLFQWVSHQVAKVLEFQLQHQSFQWTTRTVSFQMVWLDLLAVQGTLKSLPQHHSSKASILRRSKHQFFGAQLSLWSKSHIHTWHWKNHTLTRWTFVGKVMSLLFNIQSRLVIAFLLRSKLSFNFMAAVTICSDSGAKKIKSVTVSTVSPSICHEVMDPMPWS